MKKKSALSIVGGAVGAALVALIAPSAASAADDQVTELHLISAGGGKMLVAVMEGGVAFVDPSKRAVYRAWPTSPKTMRGAKADFFMLRDADSDGTVDAIATGRPAFIISGTGDPISAIKACDQVHVADFAADKSLDVACRDGNKITVTTHDGQKLWEYKVAGAKLGLCLFGDFNGDIKSDIECSIGRGKHLRISGDGTELGRDFEDTELSEVEDDNADQLAQVKDLLAGNELFDIDGDGTADESVKVEGKTVTVRSKAKPTPLGIHEIGPITSGLAEDLDGDGAAELVLGGAGKVYFIGKDGKVAATSVVDPRKLKRRAHVKVEGAGANGLEDDSSDTIAKAVEAGADKVAACYTSDVKRDPYTRVGRMVYNLDVNDKGGVKKAQKLHSDINDKKVEGCVAKALGRLKFPKATQPGASVTVTLGMGFIDE